MFQRIFMIVVLLVGMFSAQPVAGVKAAAQCDLAQFVSDVTLPDGSGVAPGAIFIKTWRFLNSGTCTWTSDYAVVLVGGDALGAPASVKLPTAVAPGQTVDISVGLKAPTSIGHYKGLWKLSNPAGAQFGIGESGADAFWVDINVVETTASIYDFVANAPYAQWKSGAGLLPYPGTSGDSRGYSYSVANPRIEDGSYDVLPGLLAAPQNKLNGYIQATYPEILVQSGDRLQTLVSCEYGVKGCYVTFRIDYLTSSGGQKTLWSWKEAVDGRFYRANLDLGVLAGKKVRFIFMTLATGPASSDRAIWGAPRILRTGSVEPPAPPPTFTPLPPLTPTPTPFGTPAPTVVTAGCDKAQFVADVTVPDGTLFSPGAAFTKTWRLKNIGRCAWTTAYKFLFYDGDLMNAPTALDMPRTVSPGQTVDLTANLVAPALAGKYRGNWVLSNASGGLFGIGANASRPIWVEIEVAGGTPTEMGYDFWANVCSAQWKNGAGALPCPGVEGDRGGFVLQSNFTRLEDGTLGPAPSLWVAPENKYNGYIQGVYPTFTVQPGDRFYAVVGCELGSNCYVTLRLDYLTAAGALKTLWSLREQKDGRNHTVDLDLSPLAGQSVRFVLTVLAAGSATGDQVRWTAPYILRAGGVPPTIPPTLTPTYTPSPTPPASDWPTYTNPIYNFQFKYPPQAQLVDLQDNFVRMNLPIAADTNLREKYLEAVVFENADPCRSPLATVSMVATIETVQINGLTFLKETGEDGGAGHRHQWVAYSTLNGNACASLGFILHSINPGVYATPPVVFDFAAESAVFDTMIATFGWVSPTLTPSATPTETLTATVTATPVFTPTPTNTPPASGMALVQSVEIQILESQPLLANAIVRGQLPDAGCTHISSVSQSREGTLLRLTLTTATDPLAVCEPLPTPFEQTIALDVSTLLPDRYTVNANGVEQSFELLTRDLARFSQVTVAALNSRNFEQLKLLMDQSFLFAFWQSQGTAYPPDPAIEQLQLNHLGALPVLLPDPGKDLNTLLDGLNPYTIVGLDPAKSLGLFVSGWGVDGKGEAILYFTRLADGSLYWYGVLVAPVGFVVP